MQNQETTVNAWLLRVIYERL